MKNIRLQEEEKNAIVNTFHKFDENAKVYLYGSRTDPSKKGGDIDILIISDKLTKNDLFEIEWEIFKQIEEQKIDFTMSQKNIENAFVKLIIDEAVLLS